MNRPPVTIAFLSWNRLHYLRATLESARLCIQYPNLEWMVSDNESTEPGLLEYLQKQSWLDRLILQRQSHADAMNQLVDLAKGKYILLWPEDVQFIFRGDWLEDFVEILEKYPQIGSLGLDGLRRCTLDAAFSPDIRSRVLGWVEEIRRYGTKMRRSKVLQSARGIKIRTFGSAWPGVCPSGIPTLTRTDIWKKLGLWRQNERLSTGLIDSSCGAENDMLMRFYASGEPLQMAIPLIPTAADIVTDPTGCKAKVRGRYRYGVYVPPPEGTFYYRIRGYVDSPKPTDDTPLSFSDVVEPIGFQIPMDAYGDRLKSSINTSVVFDLENDCLTALDDIQAKTISQDPHIPV